MTLTTQQKSRTRARRYALQAIYEWQVSGNNVMDIEAHHLKQNDTSKFDTEFFHDILFNVTDNPESLDQKFLPFVDIKIEELTPIEQAILRLGTYELINNPFTPTNVILNEAIELAKDFAKDQSHKFVNAVLDKTAKQIRENQ